MTSIPPVAGVHSANDIFKSQYEKILRRSAVLAVLLTSLMVWLSPRYEPVPYRLRTQEMQITEVEIIYEIPDLPDVAPPPVLPPVEIVDDGEPETEIPPYLGIDPGPGLPPVRWEPPPSDFVASSDKPVLVAQPKPYYPQVARLAQVEGTVIVNVLVGKDGSVRDAVIARGAHQLLNNAALEAARKCLFEPGLQRGMPVPTWVAVPYNFRLH